MYPASYSIANNIILYFFHAYVSNLDIPVLLLYHQSYRPPPPPPLDLPALR